MLLLVSAIKLIVEIALLAFAGQFVLGLLAGAKRDSNGIYRMFQVLTKPFSSLVRAVTPKVVIDRHIPVATFVALGMVWVLTVLAKFEVCRQIGMEQCR
jgi:hypothetical protein